MSQRKFRVSLTAVCYYVVVIAYMAGIYYLSSLPLSANQSKGISKSTRQIITNIAHVPLYGILAFLLLRAFNRGKNNLEHRSLISYYLAFAIGTLFAISDEVHQSFVPGRTASLLDVLLDVLGIIAVLISVNKIAPSVSKGRKLCR